MTLYQWKFRLKSSLASFKNLIDEFIIKVDCHQKLTKTSILSKYEIYIIGKTFTLSRKLYYVYDTFTRTLKIIVDKSLKILVEIELGKFLKINQNLIEKFIIKVGVLGFWGLLNLQPNFWFNYPWFLFHRLFKFVIRILIKFF